MFEQRSVESLLDPRALLSDLENSLGLPAQFYVEPTFHKLDLQAIYRREWQYIAPVHNLQRPGDVVVGYAGDIPVVVTRAEDGELHGFVNVCRHRGYKVLEKDASSCRRLVCRYHGWSYRLNGNLGNAPGSEDDPTFNQSELGLKPISVEQWGPAVFVNADPNAAPRSEFYPGYEETAARFGVDLDPDNYIFRRASRHDVSSNWKMWYDNFVECYHCNAIHSGSFAAAYNADIDAVETEFKDGFMANRYDAKATESTTELRSNNYRSLNTYPGFLILQQDDLMILSQMRPTGPETTEQLVHYFAEKESDPERTDAWIDLWEQTFTEDGAATVVQQEGFRTGAIARNRLLRPREEAVFFFNRLTIEAYRAYQSRTMDRAAAE